MLWRPVSKVQSVNGVARKRIRLQSCTGSGRADRSSPDTAVMQDSATRRNKFDLENRILFNNALKPFGAASAFRVKISPENVSL